MESKWTYISGFTFAGQNFSIWVQPLKKEDGSFIMTTKAEETTLEQMKKDAEAYGIEYIAKLY